MKEIPLTQGKVALVDDEDYEELSQHKWCAHWGGCCFYATRTVIENGVRRVVPMQRAILKGISKDVSIDHANRDGLDNQKKNLRACSAADNSHNQIKYRTNSTGYKGVTIHKKSDKFQAQIKINNHNVYLGLFADPIDAAFAYSVAAILLHGEFARTSFQEVAP